MAGRRHRHRRRADRGRGRADHGRDAQGEGGDVAACRGVTLPGLANAHSHAFQRALRGRTQRGGGSFWTWREDMYALAATMTPDRCFELAKGTYAEMLKAGITTVGEFDYLHFSDALIAAANETGIRLTLLDACYLARRLRRRAQRRAAALQRRRRRALGRARVGDHGREGRRRDPLRARGPEGPDPDGRGVGAGQAAALPSLRAAGRERGLSRDPRLHADRAAGGARRARARTARRSTPRT